MVAPVSKAQMDNSPQYFPLGIALVKAGLCEKVSDTAKQMSEKFDRLIGLYSTLAKLLSIDSGPKIAKAKVYKEDLDALKIKALITGATISIQLKTLTEWMRVVEDGYIIDVFTEEGLKAMTSRIERATQFITESLVDMEKIVKTMEKASANE